MQDVYLFHDLTIKLLLLLLCNKIVVFIYARYKNSLCYNSGQKSARTFSGSDVTVAMRHFRPHLAAACRIFTKTMSRDIVVD